jgi:hypothetical protein
MQTKKWVSGLALAMALVAVVGCSPQAGSGTERDSRYGTNTLEIGSNPDRQRMPQFDNKNIDVDGDGDREHVSGRNNISNPSVDLRSFAQPGGGSDLTNGVYPHTFTADRLTDLASSVNGVANSRALVVGRTAVLGINLERTVRPQQKGEIIQFVRQRVLVQAPEFQRVHISTDRALNRRIGRIADEIRAGHSLTMFNDDFMDLTKRIPAIGPSAMPAVPNR